MEGFWRIKRERETDKEGERETPMHLGYIPSYTTAYKQIIIELFQAFVAYVYKFYLFRTQWSGGFQLEAS
jgi:hypothetical protein